MRVNPGAAIKLIMKFLFFVVRCLWWLYLASGPIFYVIDALFDWPYRIFTPFVVEYLVIYFFVVFIAFVLISLIGGKIYRTALFVMILFGGIMETGVFRVVGFRIYTGNEEKYIKSHCDIREFEMDGKAEKVGLCDWDKNDTDAPPGWGSFFYDTSGEMADYYFLRAALRGGVSNTRDKQKWVDAIRRLFAKGQNDPFEYSSIWASPIAPHFYGLFFPDDHPNADEPGNSGFSNDYGPATSNN